MPKIKAVSFSICISEITYCHPFVMQNRTRKVLWSVTLRVIFIIPFLPFYWAFYCRKELEKMEDRWNELFWECVERDLHRLELVLVSDKKRRVELKIQGGKLTLSGEEWGLGCESINGKDEYEHHVFLDEDNTKRLLVQLRMEYGTEIPRTEMIKEAFGTKKPSSKLMEYCKKRAVEYSFVSF